MRYDDEADETLEGAVTIEAPDAGTPLSPGQSAAARLVIDKSALVDGVYDSDILVLDTDVFGFEVVPVAVIVQEAGR